MSFEVKRFFDENLILVHTLKMFFFYFPISFHKHEEKLTFIIEIFY